ncbi:DUF6691 family protein [Marinomonas spartinae]|uniref:DUF6691 family protein n=1 Tax=Marinomonas spartinae TaxID=1792290 RepID=UPI0018F26670|nr:DUF6691 family protein [Marinomonas spartinae]MBJ7554075.1 YeeE/YedE family protein [Marinomonas spartinae]
MMILITLFCGILFGVGLALSQMTNPAVVLGFLDIFGNWNPSLIFVMGSAIVVGVISYAIKNGRQAPWLAKNWSVPTHTHIDAKLVIGSALFGIGWGLSGYCPGPGLTALVNNPQEGFYFIGAVIIGSGIFYIQNKRLAKA